MIKTVHLIFKTHLDVGFTGFAEQVVSQYFTRYIPAALDLAEALRQRGGHERFVWTTGSWLIYEYLEQASPPERFRMEKVIERGDIVWHGLPFTTHTELMDADLFRYGLSLSQKLGQRFQRQTIAAKMTDVPGHTRAMIPYLVEAGIQFLHIGVNAASKAPDVPPAFVWRAPDGSEIIVLYSVSGYGALHVINGLEDALLFAHTGDNLGPPTVEDVISTFERTRKQFEHTSIEASTLDRFAEKLLLIKPTLPVVTDEIGDTWIHGVGSDPKKVSQFRELLRLRIAWKKQGIPETLLDRFTRKLLLIPEHTWGMDVKTYLTDFTNYSADDFASARQRDEVDVSAVPERFKRFSVFAKGTKNSYSRLEASWEEQRRYLSQAIANLSTDTLRLEALERLQDIESHEPLQEGFNLFAPSEILDSAHYTIAFDPITGCLTLLIDKAKQRIWCSKDHPIGLFQYETFSQTCYDRWLRDYNVNFEQENWIIPDFSKPGMDRASPHPEHRIYVPQLVNSRMKQTDHAIQVLLELRMPERCIQAFGAPRKLLIAYTFQKNLIAIRLQWFQKKACRLPEASWFSFVPAVDNPQGWMMEKLGHLVSPLQVVRNGGRNLHAIDRKIVYQDTSAFLAIHSLDAPLVAPGMPRLLQFDNTAPPLEKGMHFNLHNNVWGTNFRMWYEEDALFRFILQFSQDNNL